MSTRAAGRLALARAGLLKPEWTGLPQRAGGTSRRARRAAHRIIERFGYLQLVEADPDPSPGDSGDYEFSWDGRDDTEAERILLGRQFNVGVEADLTVSGDGWSQALTAPDFIWQEIEAPHSSNYGVDYGTFEDNFSLWAGEFAVIKKSARYMELVI